MASCGRAMPIPPAGRSISSRRASRRFPAGVRLAIVRADKGFYDHKLIEWLEARRARFVIVARLTPRSNASSRTCGTSAPAAASRSPSFATSRPAGPIPLASSSIRRPAARRAHRATDALQARAVPLPGPGHQPAAATAQPLALLQRPRRRGVAHQATQRGLRPGQHPHPPLLRQRDLLPSAPARLQSRELVQAALLARRTSRPRPSRPCGTGSF